MSEATRNDLIDAYFETMDEADPSVLEPHLAEGFVYESLSGDLEGFEGITHYMEELRGLSNTTHTATARVHDEGASAVEGVATAEDADGETVEVEFCNVYEFDDAEEHLTRVAVYINDG